MRDHSSECETEVLERERRLEKSESVALALTHGVGVSHRVLVSDRDILEDEAHAATVLRRQRGALSV